MNEIIPALIPQNLNIVREKFGEILGLAKKVQIDIVDGEYAPVKTWPMIDKTDDSLYRFGRGEDKFPYIDDFKLEVDLLVLHPIEYISELLGMGTSSFVIHIDSTDHVKECIETIKGEEREVGLGIKPSVDSALLDQFLSQIDFVQFMGSDRVGYSGVELDPIVYDKIQKFCKIHPSMPVQIDIGVTEETIPKFKEIGVTRFISNSSIFNTPNPREALQKLQNL
jgi:ribulose-phosphate 3-epimerase